MPGFDEPEAAPGLLGAVTLTLTAAAGAINVVTYFAFNQVFASTMSGNLILLGLRFGRGEFSASLDNLVAISGYCCGLLIGTFICGRIMRRLPWRNAVGATLTVELLILLGTGLSFFNLDADARATITAPNLLALIVGASVATGMQSSACRYIGPSGTPTTFLSGTVTDWVSSLAETNVDRRTRWNPPLRIATVVVVAGINAAFERFEPRLAFAVPVLLVLASTLMMLQVVRVNHRGPFRGSPQFAIQDDPR